MTFVAIVEGPADMADAFSPVDRDWRDAVIAHGVAITCRKAEGSAAW
jgi:hypothetical protein